MRLGHIDRSRLADLVGVISPSRHLEGPAVRGEPPRLPLVYPIILPDRWVSMPSSPYIQGYAPEIFTIALTAMHLAS